MALFMYVNRLYQNLFHDLSASFPSTLLSKKFESAGEAYDESQQQRPTYLPFVGTASLHPRAASEVEIRERPHALPALCAGCRGDAGVAVTHLRGFVPSEKDEGLGSEVESQGVVTGGHDGAEEEEEEGEDGQFIPVKEIALGPGVCYGCAMSKAPQ